MPFTNETIPAPRRDIRATMAITSELRQHLHHLPYGFHEVWSTEHPSGYFEEVVIEGPFPADVPDGATVSAALTPTPEGICWQWVLWEGTPPRTPRPVGISFMIAGPIP